MCHQWHFCARLVHQRFAFDKQLVPAQLPPDRQDLDDGVVVVTQPVLSKRNGIGDVNQVAPLPVRLYWRGGQIFELTEALKQQLLAGTQTLSAGDVYVLDSSLSAVEMTAIKFGQLNNNNGLFEYGDSHYSHIR